jgi:hypothetical protein
MLHDESIDTRTPQLKVFTSTTADDIEAIVRAGWLVADLEPGANGGKVSFECGSHKPQVEYAVDPRGRIHPQASGSIQYVLTPALISMAEARCSQSSATCVAARTHGRSRCRLSLNETTGAGEAGRITRRRLTRSTSSCGLN